MKGSLQVTTSSDAACLVTDVLATAPRAAVQVVAVMVDAGRRDGEGFIVDKQVISFRQLLLLL